MNWSPQQDAALLAVEKWLQDPRKKPFFRLDGFAGTGKTTLAKHFAESVNGPVYFGAYTGKAASVMQRKGCQGAGTIHSLIYRCVGEKGHRLLFELNSCSPVAGAALVVVDEVSMVGRKMAQDLLSFGVPILVLGDPFQLPPVGDEGFFMHGTPDVLLTEVHRQALDSPVLRLATDIRQGRARIEHGTLEEADNDVDQWIVGMNTTRGAMNQVLRGALMPPGVRELPVAGDKLVCLRNDRRLGLLNGTLWIVKQAGNRVGNEFYLHVQDESGWQEVDCFAACEPFFGKEPPRFNGKELGIFDYGYALTCHKSQGSQWDRVGIVDESRVFREMADRWLYTAVTRAAKEVKLYK
jgi:exodeoxyribonuclease-5